MAKFAEYYIRYKHDLAPFYWEERQDHLGKLFAQDENIVFGEGTPSEEQKQLDIPYARIFNHRVYHLKCNSNIIVMQFANSIDVPMEINYEKTVAKNEPSCFVIIDNRKEVRTVAIQNRRKAFSAPRRVAKILADKINEVLYKEYCYQFEILPEFYPEDLLKAWEILQSNTQSMCFCTPQEELTEEEILNRVKTLEDQKKAYFDDTLMPAMIDLAVAAKEAKYKQVWKVSRMEKKVAIYVDKDTRFMKNQLTFARATNTPVELVTKDGASFKCFVESDEENTDKIVHKELDDSVLEMLFSGKKKNGEKAESNDMSKCEEKILEMLNEMKHPSEDVQTNEEVA